MSKEKKIQQEKMNYKDFIVGSGGLAAEIAYHLNKNKGLDNFVGFVSHSDDELGRNVYQNYSVIYNYNKTEIRNANLYIGISNNDYRKKAYDSLKEGNIFPNLIDKSIWIDDSVFLGKGNLLLHETTLTTNIKIGDFNIFNGGVGIGHDVQIEDFNFFGTRSLISGNVSIGNYNSFLLRSAVLEGRKIGDKNTLKMNSILIKSIGDSEQLYGIPARKFKF
jgi:acetyltransferase-like isoleucine patch superfamily enzyme